MTKHANTRQRSRSRQGSADKIWAVGLAGATCVGLVGTLGVRAAADAAAEPAPQDSAELVLSTTAAQDGTVGQAVSTSGLTEAQLDDYAQALEAERARLEAYHAQLLDVAAQLQASADAIAQSRAQSQATVPASTSGKTGASGAGGTKAAQQNPKTKAQSKPSNKASKPAAPAPKPVAKPVPKPAAAPQVAKPQAQTRGS